MYSKEARPDKTKGKIWGKIFGFRKSCAEARDRDGFKMTALVNQPTRFCYVAKGNGRCKEVCLDSGKD